MTRLNTPHVRWMVATLMAVALPFCCCNGRLVTQAIGALAAIPTVALAPHHDETGSLHHGDREPAHGCCPSGPSDRPTPCEDDGPCDCDQHKQVKQLPESPTTVDYSGTLVAVLSSVAPAGWVPEPPSIARLSPAAVPRPPTSLLRLHCALII